MITVDMHVHSTYSDGTCTPAQIARFARRQGLFMVALTDHDTTSGLAPFADACADEHIAGLCGIELSADAPYTLHILGYRITPGSPRMEERLCYIRRCRKDRNIKICEKLRELGLDISVEEAENYSGGEVVARPHIARLLTEKGYVSGISEAFSKYLARGGAAYVPRVRLSAEECIALVRDAGGLAVLAHPHQTGLDEEGLCALITRLKDAGLWGIEAIYGSAPPDVTYGYLKLAKRFGLFATAGSDFHGGNKPDTAMGILVSDDFLPWARLGIG